MFQVENVKARKRQLACSLIGKPLVALAAPPKERYINSVDTDLFCFLNCLRGGPRKVGQENSTLVPFSPIPNSSPKDFR